MGTVHELLGTVPPNPSPIPVRKQNLEKTISQTGTRPKDSWSMNKGNKQQYPTPSREEFVDQVDVETASYKEFMMRKTQRKEHYHTSPSRQYSEVSEDEMSVRTDFSSVQGTTDREVRRTGNYYEERSQTGLDSDREE